MYCPNCGKKIKDDIQFCPNCGEPFRKIFAKEPEPEEDEEFFKKIDVGEEGIKPGAKKWRRIVAAIIILCITVGISGFFINSKIKDNEYDKDIEEAGKYVEQEDYDNAINIYQNLIIVRPKRETAYLKLADVYISQNQMDLALEILKEGSTKTKSKKIKKQYKKIKKQSEEEKNTEVQVEKVGNSIISSQDSIYADYIKEILIPAYGISQGGRSGIDFSFDLGEERLYDMQKPPGVFGIHSTLETDLDGDDVPELIVVRVASEDLDTGLYSEHLYVQVFRKDGDQVIELQQPKRIMRYGIMKIIDSGNLDVFVKDENGEKYLCVLNCMRSPLYQFNYNMYLDIMQVEGNAIVCRKSAQLEDNYIQDTTDLSLEEVYLCKQDNMQKNILYETDDSHLDSIEQWYTDLIEPFEDCFTEYVKFNQVLSVYFESDLFTMRSSGYSDSLPLPFDFGLSEKMKDAADVFRLRSVWANNEGHQYWDFLDYTKYREGEVQTVRGAYKNIIDEYRGAILAGDARSNTQFPDVNNLGIALSGYSNEKIFYGFYDIDSDGVEELVIGLEVGEDIQIMDIYAYDGSIARKLIYEETMAERSPTHIYEDGTIYQYSSGGAYNGGTYFYRLNNQGYAAELYERYTEDRMIYPDSPYYNENEQLTDEQFDAKIAALGSVVSVEWYNIVSDEGFAGQEQSQETSADPVVDGGDINQTGQEDASASAVPESPIEDPNAAMSAEEIAQLIVAHYNALLEPGSDTGYTIFEDETTETDTYYQFLLRYQISQAEVDEIEAGGMPSTNRLAGTVTVNKSDGTVTMDTSPETWNLWGN